MKRILYILFFVSFLTLVNCEKYDIEAQFTIKNFGKVVNSVTGQPIQGVVVSDGYSTAITDESGTYNFIGSSNARFVYYSVPEMFEIPLKDGAPNFYKRINTNLDSIETNFELTPLENGIENQFTLFSVADPQVFNEKSLSRFYDETIRDLKEEGKNYKNVYGLTLGDLVGDSPELMKYVKEYFVSTQVAFFHTIGNHDYLEEITTPLESIKSYESNFGPVDYSFNRGNVHFVVMNNILYNGRHSYSGGFTKEQINWLKSDLEHVPKDKMLILSMHIPILENDIQYRNDFLSLLKPFKEVHIMTGHHHQHRNFWHNDYNIYEHVTGAASGMWWLATINACGAPIGYSVYEIEGNKMKNWYYKSVNYPSNFQIKMYAPDSFGDSEGYIVANVWNDDKDWTIELFENDINMGEMEQYTDYDPGAYTFLKRSGRTEPENKNAAPQYRKTNHLFRLRPKDKNAEFKVKATDPFGNVYIQNKFVKSINEFKKYN